MVLVWWIMENLPNSPNFPAIHYIKVRTYSQWFSESDLVYYCSFWDSLCYWFSFFFLPTDPCLTITSYPLFSSYIYITNFHNFSNLWNLVFIFYHSQCNKSPTQQWFEGIGLDWSVLEYEGIGMETFFLCSFFLFIIPTVICWKCNNI